MTSEIEALSLEAKTRENRALNKEVIHKAEKKAERKKGFKIGFISGSGLGLVLLILLL